MTESDTPVLPGAEQLRTLWTSPWNQIKVIRSNNIYLLDIVFETPEATVSIKGEDHLDAESYDIFSLWIREHDEERWWPEIRAKSGVRVLSEEWAGCPVARLFQPPRGVRFFTSNDFSQEMKYVEEGILKKCLGLEFFAPDEPKARLLITVEQLNISVFIDEECENNIEDYFIEYDPRKI